jgi:hypothetical protein
MSSAELFIVVEGPTERTFVREILAPTLAGNGVYAQAMLIGKPGHKGGNVIFERARKDIGNFLKQRSDTYISTMFDYFRIDSEWPGKEQVSEKINSGTSLASTEKADILEKAMFDKIVEEFATHAAKKRFIPYIEMHEFEALLFSNPQTLANNLGVRLNKIQEALGADGPEDINDDPDKAPSKRLMALEPRYRKIASGNVIAKAIGIPAMREKCPHFASWLAKLENCRKS